MRLHNIRTAVAMSAALAADIAQLPATLGLLSGIFAVEAVTLDWLIDGFMALLTVSLLGFHWVLLPTFCVESIPLLDLAPTWTGSVLYVASRKRPTTQPISLPLPSPPKPIDDDTLLAHFRQSF